MTKKTRHSIVSESGEKLDVKFDSKDVDKALEDAKADSVAKKITNAILDAAKKALASYAADKAGDLIDELLLGQFKDALINIYKTEKLDKLSDDEAQEELKQLQGDAKFKHGEAKSKLDSRRDENTSTEIDPSTETFVAMWHSKGKDADVGKQLSELVAEIQKSAKKMEEDYKSLGAELKKLKVDAKDEDIQNFGPILKQMVDGKKSKEEIEKKLNALKSGVKESLDMKIKLQKSKLLIESKRPILTESMKRQLLFEAIIEQREMSDAIATQILAEGFFGKTFGALSKAIPDKVKSKVKDFSAKAIQTITSKTTSAIASMAGIATGIFTGGLGAELALKAIYAVERHGKQLSNAFERQFTRFANSKGYYHVDGLWN